MSNVINECILFYIFQFLSISMVEKFEFSASEWISNIMIVWCIFFQITVSVPCHNTTTKLENEH
jgi:hypothetical protein